MPGLVPGIHVLAARETVDTRDKPGHDVAREGGGALTRLGKPNYASPTVSNSVASMASRADLPAHTTNWNAGK